MSSDESPWASPDQKFDVQQFINGIINLKNCAARLSMSPSKIEISLDKETFLRVAIALQRSLDLHSAMDMDLHLVSGVSFFTVHGVKVVMERQRHASPWNRDADPTGAPGSIDNPGDRR